MHGSYKPITLNRITKHVNICVNGFPRERCKVFLERKKYYKWHNILSQITAKIQPHFGLVKKLYTCISGTTINSFSELENSETYVASDLHKLRPQREGYKNISKQIHYEHYCNEHLIMKNKKNKLDVRCDLIVIFVYFNGKKDEKEKFVLSKNDLQNWEKTLSYMSLIMDIPCIHSLYTPNGSLICGPWELQHGACYVAVAANEKFIPTNYEIEACIYQDWKSGVPICNKDKNVKCCHKPPQKSWQQDLQWKVSPKISTNYYTQQLKVMRPNSNNASRTVARYSQTSPNFVVPDNVYAMEFCPCDTYQYFGNVTTRNVKM